MSQVHYAKYSWLARSFQIMELILYPPEQRTRTHQYNGEIHPASTSSPIIFPDPHTRRRNIHRNSILQGYLLPRADVNREIIGWNKYLLVCSFVMVITEERGNLPHSRVYWKFLLARFPHPGPFATADILQRRCTCNLLVGISTFRRTGCWTSALCL